jgi:hypothetical protein
MYRQSLLNSFVSSDAIYFRKQITFEGLVPWEMLFTFNLRSSNSCKRRDWLVSSSETLNSDKDSIERAAHVASSAAETYHGLTSVHVNRTQIAKN